MKRPHHRVLFSSQREAEATRFRTWTVIAVALAAILFQVYIPLFFQFLSYLELPLLVTLYFAIMRRSQMAGLTIGMLVGLAQDSLSKNPLGMYGIVKTLVGYFGGSISMRFDVDHAAFRGGLSFLFYFFHQFFFWVLSRALLGQNISFEVQQTLMLGLLNALVAVSLYHFLDKLKDRG